MDQRTEKRRCKLRPTMSQQRMCVCAVCACREALRTRCGPRLKAQRTFRASLHSRRAGGPRCWLFISVQAWPSSCA